MPAPVRQLLGIARGTLQRAHVTVNRCPFPDSLRPSRHRNRCRRRRRSLVRECSSCRSPHRRCRHNRRPRHCRSRPAARSHREGNPHRRYHRSRCPDRRRLRSRACSPRREGNPRRRCHRSRCPDHHRPPAGTQRTLRRPDHRSRCRGSRRAPPRVGTRRQPGREPRRNEYRDAPQSTHSAPRTVGGSRPVGGHQTSADDQRAAATGSHSVGTRRIPPPRESALPKSNDLAPGSAAPQRCRSWAGRSHAASFQAPLVPPETPPQPAVSNRVSRRVPPTGHFALIVNALRVEATASHPPRRLRGKNPAPGGQEISSRSGNISNGGELRLVCQTRPGGANLLLASIASWLPRATSLTAGPGSGSRSKRGDETWIESTAHTRTSTRREEQEDSQGRADVRASCSGG